MPARGTELIEIPDGFWTLPQTIAALRSRDIGKLFLLVQQHTAASQTQIATACGMTQPKISAIVRGNQQVQHLARFETIAEALKMPDSARTILGLAPHARPHPARGTQQPRPLSLDPGDRQEEQDPVRRREFVGLAGATMLSAMFSPAADGKLVASEPLAPVLTGQIATATAGQHRQPP